MTEKKKLRITYEQVVEGIEHLNTEQVLDLMREVGTGEVVDYEIVEMKVKKDKP